MEAVSATAEKENQSKKKPQSAGHSGPPRATTPFSNGASSNHHNYAPSSSVYGKGQVTPAVRSAPQSSSQSAPNKRPRLDYSTTNHRPSGRSVLGVSKGPGTNGRTSPTPGLKLRSKTPTYSTLPKPVPIPKPGTQHHALGHGRVPSTQQLSQSRLGSSRGASGAAARNAGRVRRESFKPRPSIDGDWGGTDRQWGAGLANTVREEDEDY